MTCHRYMARWFILISLGQINRSKLKITGENIVKVVGATSSEGFPRSLFFPLWFRVLEQAGLLTKFLAHIK